MKNFARAIAVASLISIWGPSQAALLGYITLPNGPGTSTSDGLGGREVVSMSFGLVAAPGWPDNPFLPRETSCVGCSARIDLGSTAPITFNSDNTTGFNSFISLVTNDVSERMFFIADYYGHDQTFQNGLIFGGGSGFPERVLFGRPTDLVGSLIREIRAVPLMNVAIVSSEGGFSFESLVRWEFYGDGASFRNFTVFDPPASVPEPGVLALLGIGIVGMGFARRTRPVHAK